MGNVKRYDSIKELQLFLSPTTTADTEKTTGKAQYAGKIFSNVKQQLKIKLQRIEHYIKTLFSNGPRQWINNNYVLEAARVKLKKLNEDLGTPDKLRANFKSDLQELQELCGSLKNTVKEKTFLVFTNATMTALNKLTAEVGDLNEQFSFQKATIAELNTTREILNKENIINPRESSPKSVEVGDVDEDAAAIEKRQSVKKLSEEIEKSREMGREEGFTNLAAFLAFIGKNELVDKKDFDLISTQIRGSEGHIRSDHTAKDIIKDFNQAYKFEDELPLKEDFANFVRKAIGEVRAPQSKAEPKPEAQPQMKEPQPKEEKPVYKPLYHKAKDTSDPFVTTFREEHERSQKLEQASQGKVEQEQEESSFAVPLSEQDKLYGSGKEKRVQFKAPELQEKPSVLKKVVEGPGLKEIRQQEIAKRAAKKKQTAEKNVVTTEASKAKTAERSVTRDVVAETAGKEVVVSPKQIRTQLQNILEGLVKLYNSKMSELARFKLDDDLHQLSRAHNFNFALIARGIVGDLLDLPVVTKEEQQGRDVLEKLKNGMDEIQELVERGDPLTSLLKEPELQQQIRALTAPEKTPADIAKSERAEALNDLFQAIGENTKLKALKKINIEDLAKKAIGDFDDEVRNILGQIEKVYQYPTNDLPENVEAAKNKLLGNIDIEMEAEKKTARYEKVREPEEGMEEVSVRSWQEPGKPFPTDIDTDEKPFKEASDVVAGELENIIFSFPHVIEPERLGDFAKLVENVRNSTTWKEVQESSKNAIKLIKDLQEKVPERVMRSINSLTKMLIKPENVPLPAPSVVTEKEDSELTQEALASTVETFVAMRNIQETAQELMFRANGEFIDRFDDLLTFAEDNDLFVGISSDQFRKLDGDSPRFKDDAQKAFKKFIKETATHSLDLTEKKQEKWDELISKANESFPKSKEYYINEAQRVLEEAQKVAEDEALDQRAKARAAAAKKIEIPEGVKELGKATVSRQAKLGEDYQKYYEGFGLLAAKAMRFVDKIVFPKLTEEDHDDIDDIDELRDLVAKLDKSNPRFAEEAHSTLDQLEVVGDIIEKIGVEEKHRREWHRLMDSIRKYEKKPFKVGEGKILIESQQYAMREFLKDFEKASDFSVRGRRLFDKTEIPSIKDPDFTEEARTAVNSLEERFNTSKQGMSEGDYNRFNALIKNLRSQLDQISEPE